MRSFAQNIAEKTHNAKIGFGAKANDYAGKARHFAKSFVQNESGSFATIFGVSTLAVFMSVGVAVDYSQISRSKTIVDSSLDAAVLAAGNDLLKNDSSQAELKTVFENHLYANLDLHANLSNNVTIQSFSVDKDSGLISAKLNTPVQMAFMGIVGVNQMKFDSITEATFSTTPVEISMVLDVTGSMKNNGKLNSLKLAANDAVDILLPDGQNNSNIRLGLVPYSEGVRLSNNLLNKASGQTTNKCATERKVYPYSDVSYASEYVSTIEGAKCSSSEVLPLTSDADTLKNEINALTAKGYTAGHLGISWAYYMLSEKWQNLWPNNAKPDNYGTNTKKIAILMTDGSFNTYFNGFENDPRNTNPTVVESNYSAKKICSDMKADKAGSEGIEVYSIAFNAPADAKVTLQDCASNNTSQTTYYYDANSEDELRTAFAEIAQSIKSLRLSK